MSEVVFGQYYPASSFVHKMDSRAKIVLLIAYIVAIFLGDNFYALAACALFLLTAIIFSRVKLTSILRSIKLMIFLIVFTSVINLFFYSGGETVYWKWGILSVSKESILFSLYIVLRLMLLVIASTLLTLTTAPVSLTDGLESLLTPLKWVRFPVHELALIMSIALRFIPTLMDETGRIIKAQKARGANFESGGLISRAKAIIPILIPLMVSSFRRAEELGDAMDARCYRGSKGRTKYKKLRFGWRDLIALLLTAALITGIVFINKYLGTVV